MWYFDGFASGPTQLAFLQHRAPTIFLTFFGLGLPQNVYSVNKSLPGRESNNTLLSPSAETGITEIQIISSISTYI